MGVFAEWQPRYAEHGVATFPLLINGKSKKPATKGYARTGLKGSGQLVLKFPDVDAFAFMAGPRSNLTIVDIDSPDDEDMLRDVLARYGDTPLISRTGSGGFHCYYQHGGEGRKIRIDPTMPVDMIGGGVAAAPPSRGTGGKAYAFIRGSVADLHRLPFIRADASRAEGQEAVQRELVQVGNRNRALFEHLMREARHVDTFDAMLDVARTFADDQFAMPMPDAELVQTAKSAWGYETTGKNRFGQAATLNLHRDVVLVHAAKNPDAFALFSILQAQHKGIRGEFSLSKAMADSIGWHLRKFKAARDYLVSVGLLRCIRPGGRGPKDPPVYRFC
jgi:Primase C terminal 1 (PriCT-1)./Bifunctional DNA primase/polymerase, N-terminal.